MDANFVQRSLETISVAHYLSLFFICNIIAIPIFICLFCSPLFFLPIGYFCWMYFDFKTPYRAGRRVPFLRKACIWRYMASYFPVSLHKTEELDPNRNYMFCFHPHGIIGVGGFVNFITEANNFSKLFRGITLHPLTLEVNFYMPLFRDYMMALGLGVVSSESISYKLTKLGPGHSVMIVVGGAAEAQLADPEKPYRLKINGRKGFIREALKVGAPLVPVFSFGETEIFYQVKPSPNSFFALFQYWVHRLFRFVPMLFRGDVFILPFRKPINTVVGAPLEIPYLPNPTDEDVNYWHAKYIEALKKLFYDNKERYGCPNKELELF